MVPLGTLVTITADGRTVAGQPLQPVSDGEHRRRSGAGLQLRRGDEPDGGDRRQDPAARRGVRVDGDVLPGEDRRQPDHLCVRPGHAAGLSVPRRPVRKLDCAGVGDACRAAVADGAVHRADQPRAVQQSLYPDRAGAADRAVGQERDPDRGGRARAAHAAGRARSSRRRSRRRARGSGRS